MAATAGRGAYNANIAQWQGEQAAKRYDYQAEIEKAKAANAPLTGALDVGSTILSGASNAAKLPGWDKYF
jgi:hypothetical protein